MSIVIPLSYIERTYRHVESPSGMSCPLCWRVLIITACVMLGYLVLVVAIAWVFLPLKYGWIYLFVTLILGPILFFMTIVIVIVEWFDDAERTVSDVRFSCEGVSIDIAAGTDPATATVSITDIKSISGYVRNGWFWVRDRGVVIEIGDGKQLRFALHLSKSDLNIFLDDFIQSVSELNLPVSGLRKF